MICLFLFKIGYLYSKVVYFFVESLLWHGYESTSPGLYLPQGDENRNHVVELVVHVGDILHASVSVQINASVAPAALSNDEFREFSLKIMFDSRCIPQF